jgi:asparagine synthetase B (glutamine-hydrolysing)
LFKTFKTFDPLEIRNSAVLYFGIKTSKDQGFRSIARGMGADELFAGYNYLHRYFSNLRKLQLILEDLWAIMRFSPKNRRNIGCSGQHTIFGKTTLRPGTSIGIMKRWGNIKTRSGENSF